MYNNSYIKMGAQSRIAHLLFNSPMISGLEHEVEYLAKLRKVTEVNLTNSCQHYVVIADSVKKSFRGLMEQFNGLGFEAVVIWFEGSWPMGGGFEENLLEAMDGEWKEFKWLCAGHILDRNTGDAPAFHHQCIVINVKEWSMLKETPSPMWNSKNYPSYIPSTKHVHDDYTPMYLQPDPTGAWVKRNPSRQVFDTLIPTALENGMCIMNLNHDIRYEKHCCYPEDDVEETKLWLLDENWSSSRSVDELSKFSNTIHEDKGELYGFKVMNTHVMYITNTESVPTEENTNCTVMTAPCSGLHQFKHMVNAKTTLKRVIWTDFSEAGIWWTKKVLAEWNGINFRAFYESYAEEIEDRWVAFYANNYNPELADEFEQSFGSQEQWLEHWDWIRTLDHTFMQVDIVRDWKTVCDAIGTDEEVFMQISNIWQYEINYLNNGFFGPQAAFVGMVRELLEKNKDLFVTGDSPGGVYYNYQNMKEIVSIV